MGDSLLAAAARIAGPEAVARAIPAEEWPILAADWRMWARPEQLPPPGQWRTWLLLAGRGFGKTRTGAETVRTWALEHPGCHIALVAPTAADARDVMVRALTSPWEGGRLAELPTYEPSKRSLTWANGSRATTYSADEPDRLRGPQHHYAWADELAAWRYPDAWDQLQFGLRLGRDARAIVTTTPRPTRLVRELLAAPTTVITRGSTFDNRANLDPTSLEEMRRRYEGTRLGRQELYAELLEDTPGALWTRTRLDTLRVRQAPELRRIVVAVDPAVTSGADADETGIIVAGLAADGHCYVLADYSGRYSPDQWAQRVAWALEHHQADRVVAEVNQGGDLVERLLRTVDPRLPFRAVRASRGKATRAEPVAALYEQGRAHHLGCLAQLEDQMCRFTSSGLADGSPDRVDALVWALTELALGEGRATFSPLASVVAGRRY